MCFPCWAEATAPNELEATRLNKCSWVKMPIKDSRLPRVYSRPRPVTSGFDPQLGYLKENGPESQNYT